MNKSQFLKLKKQIDKLLDKAENEALEKGVNTTSPDFEILLKELKRRILAERGINLEEYEKLESELEKEREISEEELIGLATKLKEKRVEETEGTKKSFQLKIKQLQEEFSAEIQKLVTKKELREIIDDIKKLNTSIKEEGKREYEKISSKLEVLRGSQLKEGDIEKIVTPLIPKIPTIKDYTEEISELRKKISGIKVPSKPKDYSRELKDLRDLISGDKLEHKIHNLLGPPFRKLALGLSRRINTLDTSLASYVPYTGATANVDLGSNDLTLTGTATFGSATTESLVKILAKSEDYTKGLAVSDASYGSGCVIDGLGIEGVSVDANGNPTAFDEDLDLQYSSTGDLYLCGGGGNVFVGGTALAAIYAAIAQTMYIGTTGVAINRASAALTLASITLTTPDIGTPSAGTLTNCTGLPIATGVSGLAANVATFLATPSSANLIAAVTDETGTGALVFATSPTLVTPALGTPASGVLTNCTALPAAQVATGTFAGALEAADHGTAATDQLVNVSYGTGAAPTANTTTIGSLYITYTA